MERKQAPSGFQNFMIKATKFITNLIAKLKKMDRRFLIMIAAAAVLLIIIICLIGHGVKSSKNKEPIVNKPAVVEAENSTGDENIINNVNLNKPNADGTGKYVVSSDVSSSINLRETPNTKYSEITTLSNGTEIEVLFVDTFDNGEKWGYIVYNGNHGWVSMKYVKPAGSNAGASAAAAG